MTDGTEPRPASAPPGDDALGEVRARLEQLDEVPLAERPALFESAHEALVAELNALEEV